MKSFKLLAVAAVAVALLVFAKDSAAQYPWSKLAYFHSTGEVSPDIKLQYLIEVGEDGSGKLEYTKYMRTGIYEFKASKNPLHKITSKIEKSGILDADTLELRGSNEYTGQSAYMLTIFLDKPSGWKKRKSPVVIVRATADEKYREKAFDIFEDMEILVPGDVWRKAEEEAEKNKPN